MKIRHESTSWSRLSIGSMVLVSCAVALSFLGACRKRQPASAGKPAEVKKQQSAESGRKVVLKSSLAGTWYPADANVLQEQISGFFQKADVKPRQDIVGLILPHAGYSYSGQTAVAGLKTAAASYKRVVVIGPTHSLPMEEVLAVPRATHYQTPLGEIPLDVAFIDKLLEYPVFQDVPRAHEYEHSVQIEIPLVQYEQHDFKLVPIVAGHCSYETVARASKILKSLVDEGTLVIASSDFVHYGPQYQYVPFRANIPEQIKNLDMGAYEYIKRLDGRGFLDYTVKTGATICGRIPIAILLSMLGEAGKADLIRYTTSGELTGDFTNSVSYLSVSFSGVWADAPAAVESQQTNADLTEDDKQQLLALARKTIIFALRNKRIPEASELGIGVSDAMKVPRAAFVTLKKHSELRGCIGDIFPQRPLYKSVILNAIYAALSDRRFPPVTETECDQIKIEISALTAPKPIESADKIRIGIDGVVLNKDGRSAVFLPQVAPEQGWGLAEMLAHLSLKAGLPADAWKEGAGFLVFQADVFGEKE